jgi:hypothetical protein
MAALGRPVASPLDGEVGPVREACAAGRGRYVCMTGSGGQKAWEGATR